MEFWKISASQKKIIDDREINILVLGIVGFKSRSPLLSDAIMVVNLNLAKQKIKVISIPRDLLVQVSSPSHFAKINSLLTIENPDLKIKKTKLISKKISEITGLEIDKVAVVDLDGFKYFIDAIGGVNVYLEKTVYDPILLNPDNFDEMFSLEAGWNFMDGEKAAKFVRSRFAATGDFYRINHQHDLLLSVLQKLKQINAFSSPSLVYKIYNSWKGYLYSDLNTADAIKLMPYIQNLSTKDISFVSISFSIPDQLLRSNRSDIYGYFLEPTQGLEKYENIQNYIQNFTH